MYSSTLLSTSAHATAALRSGTTSYPFYRRLGRPQGRSGRVRKISNPTGVRSRTVQLVASSYTDCAITAPKEIVSITEKTYFFFCGVAA